MLTQKELQDRRLWVRIIRSICRRWVRRWPDKTKYLESALITALAETTCTDFHVIHEFIQGHRHDGNGLHLW